MPRIIHACTLILCTLWAIGFFVFHAGMLIHVLLVIAFISVILGFFETRQAVE